MLISFLASFKVAAAAVLQILLLAACGFFVVRRGIITDSGLGALSKLVVEVTLPLFVFTQLILRFGFSLYPNWYLFPLLSFVITLVGFGAGYVILKIRPGEIKDKKAFLALTAFQNSGYLVIPLIVALLPKDRSDTLLIYLFLFLLGFNICVWSLGVYLLSARKRKGFELGTLFTPVVLAILAGLAAVFLRIDRVIPDILIRPFRMIGECTVPLAMLVVGGCLGQINFSKPVNAKGIFYLVLAKLVLVPGLALLALYNVRIEPLVGLLIMLEAAVPSATSLSVISRYYQSESADFVNHGVFWTHIISIVTIPLFLSLFFALSAV